MLSTLKIWPTEIPQKTTSETKTIKSASFKKRQSTSERSRFKELHEAYKPHNAIDDNRVQRLNETVELLQQFQRATMNYVLNINELAKEYLLKARYREDKENFFNSFRVEPSHLMHSDLWQYSKNC